MKIFSLDDALGLTVDAYPRAGVWNIVDVHHVAVFDVGEKAVEPFDPLGKPCKRFVRLVSAVAVAPPGAELLGADFGCG